MAGALAFAVASAIATGCSADADPVAWRIDDKVLPFIPICTACFMAGGAERYAVHRRELGSPDAEGDPAAAEPSDLDLAADLLTVVAVRYPSGPWTFTADAQAIDHGEFRIYAWAPLDKDAPAPEDAPWLEPAEADRRRTAQFLVVDREVWGLCDVPWFPGAKFIEDPAGFVVERQIPDTECEQLE